jgi:hypothetical protein
MEERMLCPPGSFFAIFWPHQGRSARANNGGNWVGFFEVKVGGEVGMVSSKVSLSSFYPLEGVAFVIEFDELWCMDLIGVFSGVVTFRVALPFDEVLQGSKMSFISMGVYLIHFVFLFPLDQIGRWSGEVWTMQGGFMIG